MSQNVNSVTSVTMEHPLVSVIIPAFNAAKYLNRAIASVLCQTYTNIEVIIIDDGSTDGTAEVVKSFDDSRIIYRYQNNAGQGAARNYGMRIAGGAYITFLDSDDYYLPTKVEKQVQALTENSEHSACYCSILHFYSDRPAELLSKFRGYSGNIFQELITLSTFVQPNTLMIRREVIDKVGYWNETRYYPEDWEYSLRIARAGFSFRYIDTPLVAVELRYDSNTSMNIQCILKSNLLNLIYSMSKEMADSEREKYRIPELIEAAKFKLAMAYLAVANKRDYIKTIRSIDSILLAIPLYLSIVMVWLMPAEAVRHIAILLWKRHTRRSFVRATA